MRNLAQRLKKLEAVFGVVLVFQLLLLLFSIPARAAGARLYLSPSEGNYYVGSYILVDVLVDAGGTATNAYKATLTNSSNLNPVSVSGGGSICALWITQTPTTLECGTFNAYSGSSGKLGTIVFLAQGAGSATVSISGGNVKKADGAGTEVLSSRESATFNIQELPEGAPSVSSATHPDQNAWYQARTAEISWSAEGADGFSYTLNQNPTDTPDDTATGTESSKTYTDLPDGVHYFHVKARKENAWSNTAHFRIQVDATAPEAFEIVSDPPADKVFRAPMLSFFTTDTTSGVDHYEISIDGGDFFETTSPYRFERIRSGSHEITVRAFDQAGNTTDSKITLVVISVAPPQIIRPTDGERIALFAPLEVGFTTSAAGTVELLLDDRLIATLKSSPGEESNYTHKGWIVPEVRRLSAVYINADGIESNPAEVSFTVTMGSVYLLGITVPGFIFYPVLLALLAGLGFLGGRRIKKVRTRKKGKKEPVTEKKIEDGKETKEKTKKKEEEKAKSKP
ncbi:hypothetical protein GTO10_02375 [Candidatus Saccharibacteria bacterium]|nr:hypothetical protein [Candidatus Saccharibacteria bacterium]